MNNAVSPAVAPEIRSDSSTAPAKDALSGFAETMAATLDSLLPRTDGPEGKLFDAMRYSALGNGKFIRPYIVRTSALIFDVPDTQYLRAGAAVEMVHAYSLIHDDLPCMDDDDLRHGKPTVHKCFDEATAVLAGDALHALSCVCQACPKACRVHIGPVWCGTAGVVTPRGPQSLSLIARECTLNPKP